MGSSLLPMMNVLIKNPRPKYSSPKAPPKVMVTQYTAQTVYTYSADKLWTAYGIAALFTFCSVVVGMLTIHADGASYSSAFSTVLRVARGAELSVEVQESDLDGKNPLPSYLAKATVTMSETKDRGSTPDKQDSAASFKGPTVETAPRVSNERVSERRWTA